MDLNELIAKLESTTKPTRGLSDEVLLACGWEEQRVPNIHWMRAPGTTDWLGPMKRPNPLASIDAALLLVPDNCTWSAGECGPDNDCPWACLTGNHDDDYPDFDASAATAAIALCIAALRFRRAAMVGKK